MDNIILIKELYLIRVLYENISLKSSYLHYVVLFNNNLRSLPTPLKQLSVHHSDLYYWLWLLYNAIIEPLSACAGLNCCGIITAFTQLNIVSFDCESRSLPAKLLFVTWFSKLLSYLTSVLCTRYANMYVSHNVGIIMSVSLKVLLRCRYHKYLEKFAFQFL